MNAAATLPWFRHSKMAPGDFLVTWWVPVRNRRGAINLDPRSLCFETPEEAFKAASEKAYARKTTIRNKRTGQEVEAA